MIQCLSSSDLLSLSVMPSRPIHVVTNGETQVSVLAVEHSRVQVQVRTRVHLCLVCSPGEDHRGCLVLGVVNKAAGNSGADTFLNCPTSGGFSSDKWSCCVLLLSLVA